MNLYSHGNHFKLRLNFFLNYIIKLYERYVKYFPGNFLGLWQPGQFFLNSPRITRINTKKKESVISFGAKLTPFSDSLPGTTAKIFEISD